MTERYPIAPNGIFWSIQGEGHLRGFQMGFVRLAGCSVGCPQCDTNYSVARKLTAEEIVAEAEATWPKDRDRWVWITGGEPTDHDLIPLLRAFGREHRVALATSGVRSFIPPVDWLSVSPHTLEPSRFKQRYVQELKLVDGLHGLSLDTWADAWDGTVDVFYRYVQPLSVRTSTGFVEDPASLARCLAFLRKHPKWALSRQDHHVWSVA